MKKNKIFLFSAAALLAIGLTSCATPPEATGTTTTAPTTTTTSTTEAPAVTITINAAKTTVVKGEKVEFSVKVTNSTEKPTLIVDNPAVGEVVTENGKTFLKGIDAGNVIVIATIGEVSAQKTFTVTPAPTLEVTAAAEEIEVGAETKLTIDAKHTTLTPTVTTSAEAIATVTKKEDGAYYVKGVAIGNATITVKVGTLTDTITISVYQSGKAAKDAASKLVKDTVEAEKTALVSGNKTYKVTNDKKAVTEDTKTEFTVHSNHAVVVKHTDSLHATNNYTRTTGLGKNLGGGDIVYVHDLGKEDNVDTTLDYREYDIVETSAYGKMTQAEADAYTSLVDLNEDIKKAGVSTNVNSEVFVGIARFNYEEGDKAKLKVNTDGKYVFTAEGTASKYLDINLTFGIQENGLLKDVEFTRNEYLRGTAEAPKGAFSRTISETYTLNGGTRTASPDGLITPDALTYTDYTPVLVNMSDRELTEFRVGDEGICVAAKTFTPSYAVNDSLTFKSVAPADAATIDLETNTLSITKKYDEVKVTVTSAKKIEKVITIAISDPVVTNITCDLKDSNETGKDIFINPEPEYEGSIDLVREGFTYALGDGAPDGVSLTWDAYGPILNSTVEGEVTLIIKNKYCTNEDGTLKEFKFTTTFVKPAPETGEGTEGGDENLTPLQKAIKTLTTSGAYKTADGAYSFEFSDVGMEDKVQLSYSFGMMGFGYGYLLLADNGTAEEPFIELTYSESAGGLLLQCLEFGYGTEGQIYTTINITGTVLGDQEQGIEDEPLSITISADPASNLTSDQKIAAAIENLTAGNLEWSDGNTVMATFTENPDVPNTVKMYLMSGEEMWYGDITLSYVDGWIEIEVGEPMMGGIILVSCEFVGAFGVQDLDQFGIFAKIPGATEADPVITLSVTLTKPTAE